MIGLGHIAQVAMLPAFAHARRNSQLTALVSNDPTKLRAVARRYGVQATFSYDEYEACLRQVDAVYIALPNSMHAEYTVRAARAGVHVLCEKPMAPTVRECRRMVEACRRTGVKLMIAYRLHFEAMNTQIMDLVRHGRIGDLKYFESSFSMSVRAGDIRTRRKMGGGSVYDIGVYCINAARYLFRAEPTDVVAMTVNSGVAKLREIDESAGALLRFQGERLASFVTSFNAADVSSFRIVGTKGHIHADPAYEYAGGLSYEMSIDGRTTRKRIGKRDQFAPQLLHFSDCILNDREPEPSGEEGLQDVRIVEAIYKSARTGRAVRLPPHDERTRPSGRQRIVKPGVRKPPLVKVQAASQ